jgi:ribosomal protein S18 acetylase RimI-like enzyme
VAALLEARELADGYHRMSKVLDGSPPPSAPAAGIRFDHPNVDADAVELHAFDDQAFSANPDYLPQSYDAFVAEHLREEVLDSELSVVARRDGRIVGMALCRRWPDVGGIIDLLAVSPSERRRGLGRALLLRTFAIFAEAGCDSALLDVASDNPPALALYESAGMRAVHRTVVLEKPA